MRLLGAGRGLSIVKIGGSLYGDPRLKLWLNALCSLAAPIIIVPGGGPFADAVRDAQERMVFSDRTAHELALFAMAQYGRALCDLDARLTLCELDDDFEEAWVRRATPVWSPFFLASHREDIAQSWDMTSDSLAAWLAGELGARRVVLVKSAPPTQPEIAASALADSGIVDPLFPRYLAKSRAEAVWLGPNDWPQISQAIRGKAEAGARIVTASHTDL
ncbi:MAG: dihydroneopterin aldolase [Hyphomicrobiales bacterium]|nr:dihydroneopterin aldolase [Hyphomicrobiales bacterium]